LEQLTKGTGLFSVRSQKGLHHVSTDSVSALEAALERKGKKYVSTGRPRGRPKGARTKPKLSEALPPPFKPAAMRYATAARYLGISQSYIKQLVRNGELEARSLGTARVILTASLDALLARGAR
jgi:excisionase family DNA binding protein